MFVAAAQVILDYYGNISLPSKRTEIAALIKTLQKTFNVSVTEVADFDDFERCVLGLSLTAGSKKSAEAALKKVLVFIDANAFARVVVEDGQVLEF